jgi:hypothetical protein
MLIDHAATGNVKVFQGHDTAHKITRADVAQFCVDQLTSDEHVGGAVTIALRDGASHLGMRHML